MKNFTQGLVVFIFLFSLSSVSLFSVAQSSDVVRAKHLISQVERGLKTIKQNDMNTINGFTDKLKQAKDILEAETNKQAPSFKEAAGQWMEARNQLYTTLDMWKNNANASNAQTQQKNTPQGTSSSDLYNQLISKYQSQNRPKLDSDADVQTALDWLNKMMNLYSEQWQIDNQKATQLLSSGQLTSQDYNRFKQWVNGTWHTQIGEQINQRYQNWNQALNANLAELQKLYGFSNDDRNKVMNIAGGVHLERNQMLIQQSQDLLQILKEAEKTLKIPQSDVRKRQPLAINQAKKRLNELKPLAQDYLAEWKKAPKKSRINPTSQYLWLNGSRFAEITQEGEVWINSNFAGSIGKNGEIYQRGNYMGKIDDSGEVWLSKQNRSATFTDSGEVWISGSHVGTIEEDGTVWGTSSAASVEGPGDWRRAAVVYFLQVFPVQ
ncbi:hypothetical protein [Glaciecola sp. 1036]|uniref:hypothetical protein n=1 Tax=Alteromonadaceae TaxID=72275 RepID=UPI003D019476